MHDGCLLEELGGQQAHGGCPDQLHAFCWQVERGQQVEDGDVHPSDAGCNGYCPLVAGLPYLDYKFMWRLPLAHACLSGVLADFFDVIIEYGKAKEDERPWFGLPLEARRLIEVRTHRRLGCPGQGLLGLLDQGAD